MRSQHTYKVGVSIALVAIATLLVAGHSFAKTLKIAHSVNPPVQARSLVSTSTLDIRARMEALRNTKSVHGIVTAIMGTNMTIMSTTTARRAATSTITILHAADATVMSFARTGKTSASSLSDITVGSSIAAIGVVDTKAGIGATDSINATEITILPAVSVGSSRGTASSTRPMRRVYTHATSTPTRATSTHATSTHPTAHPPRR
jgi:hypothetical protein